MDELIRKKNRGRPKGPNTIKRSIALKEELNDFLVRKHNETDIPYNALVNTAIKEMRDRDKER